MGRRCCPLAYGVCAVCAQGPCSSPHTPRCTMAGKAPPRLVLAVVPSRASHPAVEEQGVSSSPCSLILLENAIIILYSRAGPAGCWRPGLGTALRLLRPPGRPSLCGRRPTGPSDQGTRGPQRSVDPGRGVATGDGTNLGCGLQNTAPTVSPVPWVLSPMYAGHRPSGNEGGRENARAAEHHSPRTNARAENPAPASSRVPSLGLCTYGGATARRSAARCLL